jgi:hypothetical protein
MTEPSRSLIMAGNSGYRRALTGWIFHVDKHEKYRAPNPPAKRRTYVLHH